MGRGTVGTVSGGNGAGESEVKQLVTVFVFRVADLCIPLYSLLTLILIPVLYREYRTKQIV